jgi:hypothetical protein
VATLARLHQPHARATMDQSVLSMLSYEMALSIPEYALTANIQSADHSSQEKNKIAEFGNQIYFSYN